MTEPEITLDEAKLHCRIDDDNEDTLIEGYIAAALEVCQKHIGKRFGDGLEFNPAIKVGCLLLIGFWFENREAVGEKAEELPFTTSSLWNYYRDVGIY
ncbi:TPA: head-tail connector protein [Serratia fonticola]